MKKNRNSFTEEEIKKLKINFNLAEIAKEHDLNPKANHIYKVLRKFPKNKYSRSYKFIEDLQEKLENLN